MITLVFCLRRLPHLTTEQFQRRWREGHGPVDVAAVLLDASVVVIVAISILAACFSTFFGPAIAALLPSLVEERDLGPANSAWATLDNLAFIIGPGLAGRA